MSKYIEREAAIDAVFGAMIDGRAVFPALNNLPAADVRPVVLCSDCRHRDPEDHKCDCGEIERQGCPFKVADDYFCAYGERSNRGADMRGGDGNG